MPRGGAKHTAFAGGIGPEGLGPDILVIEDLLKVFYLSKRLRGNCSDDLNIASSEKVPVGLIVEFHGVGQTFKCWMLGLEKEWMGMFELAPF